MTELESLQDCYIKELERVCHYFTSRGGSTHLKVYKERIEEYLRDKEDSIEGDEGGVVPFTPNQILEIDKKFNTLFDLRILGVDKLKEKSAYHGTNYEECVEELENHDGLYKKKFLRKTFSDYQINDYRTKIHILEEVGGYETTNRNENPTVEDFEYELDVFRHMMLM